MIKYHYFILLLSILSISCSQDTSMDYNIATITPNSIDKKNASESVEIKEISSIYNEFAVYIDTSGSGNKIEIKEAVGKLLNDLPTIIVQQNIQTIKVFYFGENGWIVRERFNLQLPVITKEAKARSSPHELILLKNIQEAVAEELATLKEKALRAAQIKINELTVKFREILIQDLDNILITGKGAVCSDLNGVFNRISEISKDKKTINVVVTDGAENCSKSIKRISNPLGPVGLIVVLVTEHSGQNGSTLVAKEISWKQYDLRSKIIMSALPWAYCVPFYFDNYAEVIVDLRYKHF